MLSKACSQCEFVKKTALANKHTHKVKSFSKRRPRIITLNDCSLLLNYTLIPWPFAINNKDPSVLKRRVAIADFLRMYI